MASENMDLKVDLEVVIKGIEQAKKGIDDLQKGAESIKKGTDNIGKSNGLKNVGSQATQTASKFKQLDNKIQEVKEKLKFKFSGMTDITTGIVGMTAAFTKATGAVANFVRAGLELNQNYENLTAKLQSLVNAADESSNIDPFAKWQRSGETAKKMIEDLKSLDAELDFNITDLSEMFASFYSGAGQHLNTVSFWLPHRGIAVFPRRAGEDRPSHWQKLHGK